MQVETLLTKAFQEFLPPERIKVSDWAKVYYELPETSAEPGKWNSSRAPYQVGIMDAICEKGVHQVSIMCCAQIGKTILMLAIICYLIDLDPCSMLMTFPSVDDAEMFSKEKLASAIRNVKPVSQKVVQKSRDASSTILVKMFVGGFLRLTGANSPGSLASMAIRVYIGDEIDKYPKSAGKEGDPIKLAQERTNTFWNWLMLLVSTPSLAETSRINQEYQKSDQRRYFVPCPYCGHKQHLVWEQIEYAGKDTDNADPLNGVYYLCQGCDRPIEEHHKRKMVEAGEWQATALAQNPNHVGFHLNRLVSPFKSWVDLALDYEKDRNDPQKLQVFWNATLGLPFEHSLGEKLDWEKLRDRSLLSRYSLGDVPNGVQILTAGVDVQGDRLEAAIWGWGAEEQGWLIEYHKIWGDPLKGETWEQLVQLVLKRFATKSGGEIRIRATCVDSGYLTQEVYHQVKRFRHLHWFAIKGVSGGNKPLISSPTVQEINYRGEKIKRGIKLYKVGVDLAKETLYSRSQIQTPGAKYLNFPNNIYEQWFKEFCSEIQVTEHSNGRPFFTWQKIPGIRNEALDTSIYAYAAANLVGLTRIHSLAMKPSLDIEPVSSFKGTNKARKKRVRK